MEVINVIQYSLLSVCECLPFSSFSIAFGTGIQSMNHFHNSDAIDFSVEWNNSYSSSVEREQGNEWEMSKLVGHIGNITLFAWMNEMVELIWSIHESGMRWEKREKKPSGKSKLVWYGGGMFCFWRSERKKKSRSNNRFEAIPFDAGIIEPKIYFIRRRTHLIERKRDRGDGGGGGWIPLLAAYGWLHIFLLFLMDVKRRTRTKINKPSGSEWDNPKPNKSANSLPDRNRWKYEMNKIHCFPYSLYSGPPSVCSIEMNEWHWSIVAAEKRKIKYKRIPLISHFLFLTRSQSLCVFLYPKHIQPFISILILYAACTM